MLRRHKVWESATIAPILYCHLTIRLFLGYKKGRAQKLKRILCPALFNFLSHVKFLNGSAAQPHGERPPGLLPLHRPE